MSPPTKSKYEMAKTVVSTIGSVAAAAMVARSVARDYLPPEFQDYLYFGLRGFINKFSTHLTMVIYESEGLSDNEIYNATQIYLTDRISNDIHRLKVSKSTNDNKINTTIELNEEFTDIYNEVKFMWRLVSKKTPTREYFSYETMTQTTKSDEWSMVLTFHRKHKDLVMNEYFPFILNYSKTKNQQDKTVKLFTIDKNNGYSKYETSWTSVNLDHPSKFATLAMDPDVKEKVMKDLDRFVARREYYRKVGKAWKRGYLLYGPPGTGKSSLIAAIANYLNFDIYDLELTDIKSNSDLRRLLVSTANRSILVVEDIDCSVQLHDRDTVEEAKASARKKDDDAAAPKITLSGFLNFIDGLWSGCGDERIIIFTTNRKDKLDPALLRPGRMDVHIHMSYCTPSGFRLLASNYHNLTQHNLFEEIENWIRKVEITPAEVAEQLLKDDDPDIALRGLIEFFEVKKKENEEAKIKAQEEEERLAKEKEKMQQDKLVAKEDNLDAKEDEKKQESNESNKSESDENDDN
ncbi:ATPase, AAA-type, core [Artemisia annua]|uniref:ATPase, AAA-type, core n=1 Tax=Artemisia annua TaxID=35608 RepID=A0A2U1L5Y6_ARTAN|nr:ATPase, AAA-type, core [Artemisia annua]